MEHPISQRIKIIIDRESKGKVVDFASKLDGISYQVISRLFKIEPKTQKFPTPTTDLILQIIRTFTSYNPKWLLTGDGSMLKEENKCDTDDLSRVLVQEEENNEQYWRGRYDQLKEETDKLWKIINTKQLI